MAESNVPSISVKPGDPIDVLVTFMPPGTVRRGWFVESQDFGLMLRVPKVTPDTGIGEREEEHDLIAWSAVLMIIVPAQKDPETVWTENDDLIRAKRGQRRIGGLN